MKKIGDLLAVGLIGISIFIFFVAIGQPNIISLWAGILGSVITFIVEINALWEMKIKKWLN